MTPVDLLVLGGSGFVGGRVAQTAQAAGLRVAATHLSHPTPAHIPGWALDLCDLPALRGCLAATQPRVIIHCAVTYTMSTSFDEAAQMKVSAESVRVLIQALKELGQAPRLVYVSTNAVFSGRHGPYQETDLPDPLERSDAYRFYGLARRIGEELALDGWADTLIARTANVDGRDAWGQINPRLARLLEPLREQRPTPRYVDRVISPTLVDNLAAGLVEICQPGFHLPDGATRVLHIAGCQPMTDYDYAQRLASCLGVPLNLVLPDHYLPPGARGPYCIGLDVSATQALLKTRLLAVDEMLAAIFNPGSSAGGSARVGNGS